VDHRNYGFSVRLASALASLGVHHACVTPGSRSTPLTLAVAREPGITDWPHLDERSSAFFALGVAKATGTPALVVCTSGTAAAEMLPAVVEARLGRVPLIVATADRPADLRGVGATQTIDQRNIFGDQVLWSHDLEPPPSGEGAPGLPGALAARAVAAATGPPSGPVHLNLQFREPLVPGPETPAPAPADPPLLTTPVLTPGDAVVLRLSRMLSGKRGLLVCGPQRDPAMAGAAAALAGALEIPIIADLLSGVRAGTHDLTRVLAGGDLLAGAGWLDRAPPEVVVRIGGLPTSKALWTWLGAHPAVQQVVIDPGEWADPDAAAALVVRADPAATLRVLGDAALVPAPSSWLGRWQRADAAVRKAAAAVLDALPFPNEPEVVRALAASLPAGATLWAASSLPVRHLDAFFPASSRPIRFEANRGANGIDGFLSSGLGWAAASSDPTYLLAGDLSALHDLTALGTAARLEIPATIVVLNNDGGGIFHLLPQHGLPEFERHFGTPHGLDFTIAAELFGVPARAVTDAGELRTALATSHEGPLLIEVRTGRAATASALARVRAAATAAVAGLAG